jgi:hypothetical protein
MGFVRNPSGEGPVWITEEEAAEQAERLQRVREVHAINGAHGLSRSCETATFENFCEEYRDGLREAGPASKWVPILGEDDLDRLAECIFGEDADPELREAHAA